MVRTPNATTTEEQKTSCGGCDETETASDATDEQADNLLGRAVETARTVADLLAPFTSLLTAVVQGFTAYTLIQKA